MTPSERGHGGGVRLGAAEGVPCGSRGQTGCPRGWVDGSPNVTPVWHRAPGAAQMGTMPPASTS